MKARSWKRVEQRLANDLGVQRIPVTGERHGADFEDGIAAYQVKCRKSIPGWLWGWLSGIQGNAGPKGKAGILVLKTPRMQDEDALVVLSWKSWTELHGVPKKDAHCQRCGHSEYDHVEWCCPCPGFQP